MQGQHPDTANAAEVIKGFEGFSATPYLDGAGVATIGFGTICYPNGHKVAMTDAPITPTQAMIYLEHDLEATAKALWLHMVRQPTSNQWIALLSITYNEGVFAICSSTLMMDYNQGLIDQASQQFLVWNKIRQNGVLVVSPGLVARRNQEKTIFLTA